MNPKSKKGIIQACSSILNDHGYVFKFISFRFKNKTILKFGVLFLLMESNF